MEIAILGAVVCIIIICYTRTRLESIKYDAAAGVSKRITRNPRLGFERPPLDPLMMADAEMLKAFAELITAFAGSPTGHIYRQDIEKAAAKYAGSVTSARNGPGIPRDKPELLS